MRKDWSHLEKFRVTRGSAAGDRFGLFAVPHPTRGNLQLLIIATDGNDPAAAEKWEHVSVHVADVNGTMRTPGWAEMAYVKDLFWGEEETVMQLHVPAKDHVNHHDNVLHLWRPLGVTIPVPPKEFV